MATFFKLSDSFTFSGLQNHTSLRCSQRKSCYDIIIKMLRISDTHRELFKSSRGIKRHKREVRKEWPQITQKEKKIRKNSKKKEKQKKRKPENIEWLHIRLKRETCKTKIPHLVKLFFKTKIQGLGQTAHRIRHLSHTCEL